MDQPLQAPPPVPTTAPAAPLPLRFNAPAGWPAPSVDWLAANQGWDPPPGWVPAQGVQPAPPTWSWWSRDPIGWKVMTSATTASFRNGIIISSAIFLVGAVLTILPLALHVSFSVVFWGAIVFAPINVVRNITALRRAGVAFDSFIRNKASEVRQTLDTASYSDYLASSPVDALPFETFLARRGDEAWSFTGQWPLDQHHLGVTEQFRIPAQQNARGRRIGTFIFAGAAVVAVIAIVAGSLASVGGSGTTATAGQQSSSQQSSSDGSSSSKYNVSASFVGDNSYTSATCPNDGDCWVVRLKADPSCTNASLMIDFYTSKTAQEPTRSKDFSVALKDGKADVAVPAASKSEEYADIYQAHCVLRD